LGSRDKRSLGRSEKLTTRKLKERGTCGDSKVTDRVKDYSRSNQKGGERGAGVVIIEKGSGAEPGGVAPVKKSLVRKKTPPRLTCGAV